MDKNYNDWMVLKRVVHSSAHRPDGYKEREVWWVCLGENIGIEEDGKGKQFSRPVLIIRGFSKELFWGIPLSTTENRGPYYHEFILSGRVSVALISQIRTMDTSRLIRKHGFIGKQDFLDISNKLSNLFRKE